MSSHRLRTRRTALRPGTEATASEPSQAAQTTSVEDDLVFSQEVLPRPAGFGTEASTAVQSMQLLDEYQVPPGTAGRLREVALSIESNGEAKVSVSGTIYGPFTGAVDFSIPLDDAVLSPGYEIRVFHQSTDGNTTTTKATAVVLEV